MTRTDALISTITAELEARRAQLDADDGLVSVGIIVKLDETTGKPRQIIWRPESQRRVGLRDELPSRAVRAHVMSYGS